MMFREFSVGDKAIFDNFFVVEIVDFFEGEDGGLLYEIDAVEFEAPTTLIVPQNELKIMRLAGKGVCD